MKTNKDVIFAISLLVWLTSNILCSIFFQGIGVMISNFVCILLFSIMTFFKITNKTFGNWLEQKLK
jgi:uncharacterized protein with PQ loop repeat